jgi:hypothetical protein
MHEKDRTEFDIGSDSWIEEVDFTTWESVNDGLKTKINNLCWECLPGTMTIHDAEILACKIYDLFYQAWHNNLKDDE